MKSKDYRRMQEIAISAAALGMSYLIRKSLEAGYEKVFDEEAPDDVQDEEINWAKVIGWTVISGVAVTATRIFINRLGGRQMNR